MSNVLFKRLEDSSELDNMPVIDGSLYITKDGKTFIDYDEDRIPVGGTPDTEMSDRSTNTVENKVIKEYVDTNFIQKGKILWTNTSPQYGFGADTIQLSETLNNYDMYEIIFQQSTTTARLFTTGKIPVGYGTILCWHTSSNYYRPTSETVSGTSITFENGKNGSSQDNGSTIPMYVIGYKTGLFS